MNKLLGVKLLGIKLRWDLSLVFQSLVLYNICGISDLSNYFDPWLYDESRARIDGASLSNSFIVVTNKLDRFQSLRVSV